MASAREHFALDWIKSDLLETLNEARVALDDYAEQGEDETRLRACLTSLHQVHGTLVMLELKGVTLLADHLEQLAQAMMSGLSEQPVASGQALMQGILELPGYLDELQRGGEDSVSTFIPLVNEIRGLLKVEPLADRAGTSLTRGAGADVLANFERIGGPEKVARMRSAYQNVLLSILKGEDRAAAVGTLQKIATGLQRLTAGSALERQWQAFGEFVLSLAKQRGALESEAVKMLRRVDLEIKSLAKDGAAALRKPANMDLVQQLLDAARDRQHESEVVAGLREAVSRDLSNNTLAISGRQALASAAVALRDELVIVKDKLDLLVRAQTVDLDELRHLTSPLKQIGSTLSLLGFESSREIVADQVDAIDGIVVVGDRDPAGLQTIAAALVQIEEHLVSAIQGSSQSEVEQITSEAQLQVLREARKGLDATKTAIVDFVTAHWDVRHLEPVPQTLRGICGALEIIPLTRAIEVLQRASAYIVDRLMQGHRPDWQELDKFADAISGVDYFLERLAEENAGGAEDVLQVAERRLAEIDALHDEASDTGAETRPAAAADTSSDAPGIILEDALEPAADTEPELTLEAAESHGDQPPADDQELTLLDAEDDESDEGFVLELEDDTGGGDVASIERLAGAEADFEQTDSMDAGAEELMFEDAPDLEDPLEDPLEDELEEVLTDSPNEQPDEATLQVGADASAAQTGESDAAELVDIEHIESLEEPQLVLEDDDSFDLSSDVFDDVEGMVDSVAGAESADAGDAGMPIEAEAETVQAAPAALDPEILSRFQKPTDAEPPDAEIVEIFVEEVEEVLETLDEWLPQWAQSLETGEPLTEVRRAFHTLKGSGRIVQAMEIGELAWGVENMLNRIIDGTVEPTSQFAAVAREARDLIPTLSDGFEQGRQGDLNAIAAIIERADVLASGGEVEIEPSAPQPQAAKPETEPVDAAPAEPAETAVDTDDLSEDWLDEPLEDADSAFTPEPSTLQLFLNEADEHLSVIETEQARIPWKLSEPMARAFHTLAGSAAMAGVETVRFIVDPAYQVVEAFRGREPSDELKQFFGTTLTHLRACLAALGLDEPWEDPLEFVALADDLMAGQKSEPRPVDKLLHSAATAALFDAEAKVEMLQPGAPVDPELLNTLSTLVPLAGSARQEPLADLAAALMQALTTATIVGGAPAPALKVIKQGYERLIDQLNTLAVGESARPEADIVQALLDLDFEAAAEVPDLDGSLPVVDLEAEDRAAVAEPEPAQGTGAGLDFDIDPELIDVFFEEAEEINEELESNILSWSQEMDNRLYMENLLRSLHTLKGSARLCGLSDLGDMAHDFESAVIEVQNDERMIDADLFAELHKRYDGIVGRVGELRGTLTGAAVPQPVPTPVAEVAPPAPESEPVQQTAPEPSSVPDEPVEPAAVVDRPAEKRAPKPRVVGGNDAPAQVERPQQEMVRVGSALLEELVNLAGENSILRARIEQGMSDFTSALDEMETTIERLREQLRRLEIETETQILYRHERSDGPSYENFDPLEMDRYSQLQQLSRGLSESASDMLDLKDTLLFKARESETLLLQQARINTELQEGLMRTRMVPFSRLLPRLRRIVRQVGGELGKEVDFHIQNAEGELDRNLLERMVPPLEHMLRNAVDHGIETVEMRRNFGKPAMGRIDLRLSREGGDVVIEISDDGAGIDVEGVRAKAIERNLMTADSTLSDEEVLQFILAAGFSTAKSVTQISGRGVGMDVVHSEVKQLGGSINIYSRAGQGTRFVLRVPFTVSVNRALMVSVAEDLYAIPLNTIEGIVLLNPDQLKALYSGDNNTFEYAGVPYRVRYLGQYLGREYHGPGPGQTSVPMVLVRSGDHAVAIHVDWVQGSREIVVKSLGPQFAGVGGISGATILGDGSVVVILDLLALIRAQHHQSTRRRRIVTPSAGRPRCVMVVDDSVTVRKVTSRLLERQGMDVLVAKDGIEAVAMLQERRPDVMLLDIEMPRMDGFEVARQVRHDERLDSLPIVMISSRTGDKHKEHASQLGVNRFLGKPFQENELLATIDELVGRT